MEENQTRYLGTNQVIFGSVVIKSEFGHMCRIQIQIQLCIEDPDSNFKGIWIIGSPMDLGSSKILVTKTLQNTGPIEHYYRNTIWGINTFKHY